MKRNWSSAHNRVNAKKSHIKCAERNFSQCERHETPSILLKRCILPKQK